MAFKPKLFSCFFISLVKKMKKIYRWSTLSSILILWILNFTSASIVHNDDVTTYYDMEWNAFPVWSITVVNNRDSGDTITLLDRNLWATEYYNQNLGSPNASSYWYFFQWWNNYWFSWQSYTPSAAINASSYSWSNPYYSNVFRSDRAGGVWWWDTSHNEDLWGWAGDYSNNWWRDTTADGYQRQWPCPAGWHVPSLWEWNKLIEIIKVQSQASADWPFYHWTHVTPSRHLKNRLDIVRTFNNQVLIPPAWIIIGQNGNRAYVAPNGGVWQWLSWLYPGGAGYDSTNFWTSSPLNWSQNSSAYFWYGFQENLWQIWEDTWEHSRSHAFPMRCFKDLDTTELELTFNTMWWTSMNGQSVPLNWTTHEPWYDPKRTWYTFSGWYEDQELTTPWKFGVTTISQNTTIYAKWTPIPYTVTFDSMWWSSVSSQTVNYGSWVLEPVAPTKVWFSFAGWCKDSGCTDSWDFAGDIVTWDTTLYAKWDEITRVVSWYNYDGTPIYSGSYRQETIPEYTWATPTKPATVSTVYTHNGWTPAVTAVTADTSYTATFSESVREYTITWLDDGGNLIDTTQVAYNTMPSHSDPSKTSTAQYDYTFSTWSPSLSLVTWDFTYTAQFTPTLRTYTVIWKNDNGATLETDTNVAYWTTPTYDWATPTKAATVQYSYTFAWWNPTVSSVEGNITYTATFSQTTNEYLITFKNENGTVLQTWMVEYWATANYTWSTPTKEWDAQYSYSFAWWNPSLWTVTQAQVYTATYNQSVNSYTITWLDDHDSVIDTTTWNYGTMPSHSDPMKTWNTQYSYTFAWWTPELVSITWHATYKATYIQNTNNYTVTVNATPNGYWTVTTWNWAVTSASITAPYWTSISTWWTTLTIGSTTVTATPSEQTAQYTYTFSGRTSTCGNTLTENCSINVVFTRDTRSYLIRFVNYDGTELQSSTMQYGWTPNYHSSPNPPLGPSSQSTVFTFSWWTPIIHSVDGPQVYTAVYTEAPRSYSITWNYKDSSGNDTGDIIQVNYGKLPTHADPVQYTQAHRVYTFTGWNPRVVVVTWDIIYTAQYTNECEVGYIDVSGSCIINNYEITWEYRNELWEITTTWNNFAYEANPVAPTLPTISQSVSTGYRFTNWNPAIHVVTWTQRYIAQYTETPRSYTVSFNSNGWLPAPVSQNVLYGVAATAPTMPEKTGYSFDNWYLSWSIFDFSTAITGDITLDAKWNITYYTITYNDWESLLSWLVPTTYTIEDAIPVLPVPTKAWYIFSWWLENGSNISSISTWTYGNKQLQAEWKVDTNGNWVADEDEYLVTTSVESGTITASEYVYKNTSFTVNYTWDVWYALKSVTVDWSAVNRETYANSYTFSNVTSEHTIAVVYGADTNNNWTPDEEETAVKVTVDYVYAWWRWEASPSVSGEYLPWISYRFTSPEVQYYTADIAEVSGVATVTTWITVTYSPLNDDNHNNIADEQEAHFTVEFSGWSEWWTLSGQAVWEDILTWLTLSGAWIKIPEPVAHSGYVFGWWEPKTPALTDVVSTWVVYSVVWKVDANGNGVADEDEVVPSNGWWSGRWLKKDFCPDGDYSDSYYDWQCEITLQSWLNVNEADGFSQEFLEAYNRAYKNWITTMDTIQKADMEWWLTRIAMAKMLSQYAINVLWKTPDMSRVNKFNDVSEELDAEYNDWVTLAYQLWIMWINMPNNNFRPFDLVPRAEFVTALSRMLYHTLDWEYEFTANYFVPHINVLQSKWIITNVDPYIIERRWYVMIMLMRSEKNDED